MKAWVTGDSPKAPPMLVYDAPVPTPGPGEILVRVQAAGVTPTELSWYPTSHHRDGSPRTRAILGHEFAGTIVAVGEGVTAYSGGEEIFGMNDWFEPGVIAEFCVTTPGFVALKPRSLSFAEAATVPIGALTAWQGLVERAMLQKGERVLIHGGAGAVGVYAVQLARLQQAHVITTASERNRQFLMQLGANEVIDYRTQDFAEAARGIDVVFDTVGGEVLRRSWELLNPGGRLVTIASDPDLEKEQRHKNAFLLVQANGEQLARIARLLDDGTLHTVIDAIIPCTQADAAFCGRIPHRMGRGKMVVLAELIGWELDGT